MKREIDIGLTEELIEGCVGGCKYDDIKLIECNVTEKAVKFTYKCQKCGKIRKN